MKCRKAKKLVAKYHVDEIDQKKQAALEEHLSVCSECRGKLASLELTEQLLSALPREEPPAGLWNGLRERIVAEEASKRTPWKGWFRKRTPVMAMAALAIAVIFAGFFTVRSYFIQPDKSKVATSRNNSASVEIYIEQHALKAWRDPLANKAELGWSVQLINTQEK